MTSIIEVWVNRSDIEKTQITRRDAAPLTEGQIRVSIDQFGLTANNVSYAVTGDMIGYWHFFPAEDPWGIVPVWGIATVEESRQSALTVGEKLYGYFPFASHAILEPGPVSSRGFVDQTAHRQTLPALYNQYSRLSGEPDSLKGLEDERCLYFPLFATSYVLFDYLSDNQYFGAEQIIIGSASSKTGFGLANLLYKNPDKTYQVIGLTSDSNRDFVQQLNMYDEVCSYPELRGLASNKKTAFIDMSGHGPVRAELHQHFGENVVLSCLVGATHWQEERGTQALPGAKPEFFFAPGQIAKRDQEWGKGILINKAYEASAITAVSIKTQLDVQRLSSAGEAALAWTQLVSNQISPQKGLIASIKS